MECAAADGTDAFAGGEVGVPEGAVPLADRSLADEDGTGRKLCPAEGLAGSRGGALRLFLGIEATG